MFRGYNLANCYMIYFRFEILKLRNSCNKKKTNTNYIHLFKTVVLKFN